MFSADLATLVRDALKEIGSEEVLQGDSGSDSTIMLDLHHLPSIYISKLDGQVWLYSQLVEHNDNVFDRCSTRLLNALMQGCSFVRGGQLQLAVNEGYLELRGLLSSDYSEDGQRFSVALDGYLEQLQLFVEAVQ
ncbi:MAG: SPI-1 type III secretion system chaperone SpaK [Iodobacter sp.]